MIKLRTILDIQDFTRKIHSKVDEIPWALKVGGAINTGEAVVGNMGVDGQRDFTVVGDTVNVAFRLEDMTTQFKLDVLIGNDAASELEQLEEYFVEKKMFVKGKETGITAYGCSFAKLAEYLSDIEGKV